MQWSKSCVAWITALALYLGGGGFSWAGPELKRADGLEGSPPTPLFKESVGPAATVIDQRRLEGLTLRCWQEGRLLYEGGGFRPLAAGVGNAVQLVRTNDAGVTLFDMKQGLCILTGQ